MAKLDQTVVIARKSTPVKGAKSPFPLDAKRAAPPKAPPPPAKGAVRASVKASPPKAAAVSPKAPTGIVKAAPAKAPTPPAAPPAPKRLVPAASIVAPQHKGAQAEARAMLTTWGIPAEGDPRVMLHGAIVRGAIFRHVGKGKGTLEVQGGSIPFLLLVPDDAGAVAMGRISAYWGTPREPLNADLLRVNADARALTSNAAEIGLDELAHVIAGKPGIFPPKDALGARPVLRLAVRRRGTGRPLSGRKETTPDHAPHHNP